LSGAEVTFQPWVLHEINADMKLIMCWNHFMFPIEQTAVLFSAKEPTALGLAYLAIDVISN
jgi:hypothetical protein